GGLNELLTTMLHNENKDIPYHELKKLLHKIEDDATEMYHTNYGSDDTKIGFSINSNKSQTLLLWDDRVLNRLNVLENLSRKIYI
ncbi:MAG TPA: hypothetical protein VF220_09660, partial [Nitrososphaeraceae archaeon]